MSVPSNNGLHQTRRGGAAAARPVVEARLAAERECSTATGWQSRPSRSRSAP